MAAHAMKLDILTPVGPVREGADVPGVEVPGIEGELGILPQHESFVTAIVPGVIRFREGAKSVRLAVGAGFLEVDTAGRVVVLVERALAPEQIDAAAAQAELAGLEREIAAWQGPVTAAEQRDRVTRRAWLQAQIRCAKG
jgi:F-type H+-transporting ATPase subunit epsilon